MQSSHQSDLAPGFKNAGIAARIFRGSSALTICYLPPQGGGTQNAKRIRKFFRARKRKQLVGLLQSRPWPAKLILSKEFYRNWKK